MCLVVVDQPQAEVAVDLELVVGVGLRQGGGQVPQLVDDRGELRLGLLGEGSPGGPEVLGRLLGAVPLGLGLRDPPGHDGRVGSGIQGRPVAASLASHSATIASTGSPVSCASRAIAALPAAAWWMR